MSWVHRRWLLIEAVGVDSVSEVVEEPVGVHAESHSNELRVQADQEIDEPSRPQCLDGLPAGIEHVGQIGTRGWGHAGFGDFGDDEVGVAGSEPFTMGQTGLDGREGRRVERHRVRPSVDVYCPGREIDVGDEQLA